MCEALQTQLSLQRLLQYCWKIDSPSSGRFVEPTGKRTVFFTVRLSFLWVWYKSLEHTQGSLPMKVLIQSGMRISYWYLLVIYDIVDNRRRGKMVKLFESYGNRVQKSAFEALLTLRQYNDLIPQIVHIMDEEDNVRLYRLNSSNEIVLLGKSDTIYEEEVIII